MRTKLLIVAALATPCSADWSATSLHPSDPSVIQTVGYGVGPGVQVGSHYVASDHAALWTGSAGSFVDLHPSGPGASNAFGAALSQQVGQVTYGFTDHAALWYGSAASFVDLHPLGASESSANGTDGALQVGGVDFGLGHAAYWAGSPGSFVDIHPGLADVSSARAIRATEVGGYALIGSEVHAGYWIVPPSSPHLFTFTDLHPTGAASSMANAIAVGVQGGTANFAAFPSSPHAALWSGSAASVLDLNPPGAAGSTILGMDDGVQTGHASFGGTTHAGIWTGTAGSFIDLAGYLPAGYSNSRGEAVYADGTGFIQVVGYATHLTDSGSRIEAIVWTIPEPTSVMSLVIVGMIAMRRVRR
ncbi:MAG TPA: hypothetical protein PK402_00675 [Tepidisphaeraceae bacterium]|nr:hypothetical protein [Tepidisphaeraceae bacterium]